MYVCEYKKETKRFYLLIFAFSCRICRSTYYCKDDIPASSNLFLHLRDQCSTQGISLIQPSYQYSN